MSNNLNLKNKGGIIMKDNLNKEIKNNREYKKGKITILQFLEIAVNQFYHNKLKLIALTIGTIVLGIVLLVIHNLSAEIPDNKILMLINNILGTNIPSSIIAVILAILFYIVYVIGLSIPFNSNKICEKIYNAGIVNYARGTAIFIASYINPNDKNTMIYKFFTNSTLLTDWEKNMSRIEIYGYIVKGIKKLGNNKILLCLTKEDLSNPKPKIWSNDYLQKDEIELKVVLGVDAFGNQEIWNMSTIPHGLDGGESNSGKTTSVKLVLAQALALGHNVIIADFKNAIDYEKIWHDKCKIVSTKNDLLMVLDNLIEEYDIRVKELIKAGVNNIDNYNKENTTKMKHIILAFDEVAEVLSVNKKYLSKEEQEQLSRIEENIEKIARLGRMVGIHLLLSTQRPSADLISGQTRTNIGYRICFRADEILSNIILDNKDASEKIPKNARGLYISNVNKTLAQCYWIDDYEKILNNNKQ